MVSESGKRRSSREGIRPAGLESEAEKTSMRFIEIKGGREGRKREAAGQAGSRGALGNSKALPWERGGLWRPFAGGVGKKEGGEITEGGTWSLVRRD